MNAFQQLLQSASNATASNVSGPVDLLGMALRKMGVPVPQNALMSSQWMAENGLTRDVPMGLPRLAGETLGMTAPIAAAAKAPQVANALIKGGQNLAAPRTLNPQTGAIVYHGNKTSNAENAREFAERLKEIDPKLRASLEHDKGGSVYALVMKEPARKNARPSPVGFKARFSDHPQYWGASISADPITRNSIEEMLAALKFHMTKNPEDFIPYRAAHFDPGLRTGTVADVTLNRNVLANGGQDYLRQVSPAKFSLLDR